jgi:signal transduction histidine kinase
VSSVQRREAIVDGVVVALAFAVSALVLAHGDAAEASTRAADPLAYALLAVYSVSPLLRRRAPGIAVGTGLAAGLAYAAAGYPAALTPVALLSVYSAAGLLPQRRARLVLAAALLVGVIGVTLGPGPTDVGIPALIVSVWLLGNFVGTRRTHTAELERKNRDLQQARLELAERAVADERLRIARELHDVVAHSMSVVALHAGTGRMVADANPAAARDALAIIETATRSALQEMRRLLGVLRASDSVVADELAPAPGLRDVDALVADVVRSGVTVEVQIAGERPDVPPGVDLSAFRIVQEALTNVIKHGGGAQTRVVVEYSPTEVVVEVSNAGCGPRTGTAKVPSAGHGIAGMRERVALYGGDFDAGARPGGGFLVRARLPFAPDEAPGWSRHESAQG